MLEDLQAKRRSGQRDRRIFTARTAFFSLCVLVLFAVQAVLILTARPEAGSARAPSVSAAQLKQIADRLKVQSVRSQAIRYYERYLDAAAGLEPAERANVSYIVADLAAQEGRYEEALAWLVRAEQWQPNSDLAADMAELQRRCFERLGRPLDADYQLASAAALDSKTESQRGKLLATIGAEKVTMGDVDDAIQALPQQAREMFSKPEHKAAFVQQYINTRILYQKARNLGYDRDADVRKQFEAVMADLVVQAFVKKEVQDKIQVSESDLKLYYQVHQPEYGEPAQIRLAHILVGSETTAAGLIAKAKAGADFADLARQHSKDTETKGNGGEIPDWLSQGGTLQSMPGAETLSDVVFALKPGSIADTAVKSKRGVHVVKVVQKKGARVKPLSEVRKQIEMAYRLEKERAILAGLLKDAHEQLNVQLFPEALAASAPAVDDGPKKLKVK